MPELPEVQTIVNDLNRKIIGRRILNVWFDCPKIIKKPKAQELGRKIKNSKIERISRRGKNILIYLDKDRLLLIHLKMTGHLLLGKWSIRKAQPSSASGRTRNIQKRPSEYKIHSLIKGPLQEKVNNYIHVIFYLDNGSELGLSDLRKFAKILFGPAKETEEIGGILKIGPEPLDPKFSFGKFKEIISKQKRKIKQVLMDPEVIAGIGNIYSDDILWLAKIHPFRPGLSLKPQELKKLYVSTRQVLKKGLKMRGTSISDFRDPAGNQGFYANKRFVYQREKEPCLRCKTSIRRIKLGGRSAHYCPSCQKI